MGVLPRQAIQNLEIIWPCKKPHKDVNGNSCGLGACGYDVTLDRTDVGYRISWGDWLWWVLGCVCLRKAPPPAPALYLRPGSFHLVSAQEYFTLPVDIVGEVKDKSSLARRGLAVQNTVLEPGWRGYLTLELSNHSGRTIKLYQNCALAQVIFYRLEEATQFPYQGKYQDQAKGPQAAR